MTTERQLQLVKACLAALLNGRSIRYMSSWGGIPDINSLGTKRDLAYFSMHPEFDGLGVTMDELLELTNIIAAEALKTVVALRK